MAFTFSNPGGGSNNTSNPTSVDSSIIGKLSDAGYNINQVGVPIKTLMEQSQPTRTMLVPGATVPTYQTSDGNTYIVDERSNVYVVTKVNPIMSEPIRPQNPFTPAAPIVPPISIPPNNGGGGFGNPPVVPPSIPPVSPLPPSPGGLMGSGKIFTRFEVGDIVPNQESTITRALWSGNIGNLLNFHTSSAQTATQKRYYYEIFNSGSGACGREAQFSVAYGHKRGSGSADEGGQVNDTPSKAIYGQYRLMCLEPGEERFIINGTATNHIYVINVNRARFRERLDEGNIELNLHHLSGSEFIKKAGRFVNAHTGSNVTLGKAGRILRLIDDSKVANATITSAGEIYNIVSGSIENGVYNSSAPKKYGLMYPRLGVMILDARALDASASFLSVTGSEVPGDNAYKLYKSISGSAKHTDLSGDRLGFQGRSSEKVKSTHYFVRVKNGEYNLVTTQLSLLDLKVIYHIQLLLETLRFI